MEACDCNEPKMVTSELVWVQCGVIFLTNHDRKVLVTGQKLTDQFCPDPIAIAVSFAKWVEVNLITVALDLLLTHVSE